MWYAHGHLLCLLAAGLLGGAMGWLASGLIAGRTWRRLKQTYDTKLLFRDEELADSRDTLRNQAIQMESLRSQLATTARNLRTLEAALSERDARIKELEAELLDMEVSLEELKEQAESATSGMSKKQETHRLLEGELSIYRRRLATCEEENRRLKAQAADLDGRTAQAVAAAVSAKDQEIEKLRSLLKDGSATVQRQAAKLREVEFVLQATSMAAEAEREVLIGRMKEKDEALAQREARLHELEGALLDREHKLDELAAKLGALREPAEPSVMRDDLKLIRGIGPVLEHMLNDLGVHTFKQIASWGEEEIRHFEARLGSFKGRIRRDNWVQSARELDQQKDLGPK